MTENGCMRPGGGKNGLAFILPIYDGYVYARRAALSFFKYTPVELNPICLIFDDASPSRDRQDWDVWYEGLPQERIMALHYTKNGGLTRSWNVGLSMAKLMECRYAIAGNSDILFTEGWYEGLMHHLDRGTADLVGPITNAPGRTQQKGPTQNIADFIPGYEVFDDSDSVESLTRRARELKTNYPIDQIHYDDINGFFTMAKVETWWSGSFDEEHVFDPSKKMAGNEDELESRWKKLGRKIGFVPSSFIFHYRSVSRGTKYLTPGWSRLKSMHEPI